MKTPFVRTRHTRSHTRTGRDLVEGLETRQLLASISGVTPYNGQQSVGVGSNVLVTFGSAMNSSTLTSSNVSLRDSSGNVVPSAITYNATTRVLTLNPNANLVSNSAYYTLRVAGGASGVKGTDGTGLSADYVMGFTCGTANIQTTTVWSGLNKPINIEFANDGRIFVAEQGGIIKMFDSLSDTTPTQVADFRTNVHNFWDRGLLGMALDPKFTSGSPYIYILYTYDASIGGTAPTWGTVGGTDDGAGSSPTGTGANVSGRLSRFTVGENGVMNSSEQVLINDWNQQFPSHSVGDLKFGPDGYLYASGGDGASFNTVDYGQFPNGFGDPTNEGGALRSQDILSDGDPAGLNGSVIRIDPATGAAAPGNPYSSSSDPNKRRIIANGLRNPFRLTFKPGTKELFIAETGWNTWEEINRIPDATDNKAENFGWPAYEGMGRQDGYDAANLPLLENFYANPSAHTTPWFSYAHSDKVVAGSNEPTGGSTPTGIAFYGGGSYPIAYEGALFFCDYARGRLYVMYKGPDGQINQSSRQIAGVGGYVELTIGPGGDLFAVNLSGGMIERYVATGYNRAPVAKIVADKTGGSTPLTVNFDGTTSTDPDGGALSYSWDLNGDGVFGDSTAAKPSFTYTQSADVNVSLRVTDIGGLSSTATLVINVANRPPVPTINAPLSTLRWRVGDTINFSGSAIDPEDGTLAAAKLTWDLVLMHANEIDPTNVHEHRITGYSGVANGSFVAPDHQYPSWLELRLTATDSRGLSATTTMRVDPKTTLLNFLTAPAGLKLVINGSEYTTPFSRTVISGSANSMIAAASQTLGGTTYNFGSWSQGGAASQNFTAPDTNTTYTAAYTAVTGGSTPTAPTLVGSQVLTGPQVKLTWNDLSNNETSFIFQRRFRGWIWEDLATTAAANATTFTDTGVIGGVVYEYRVAAKNAAGVSAWSNIIEVDTSTTTPPTPTAPAAPSSLTAIAMSTTRVDLAWADNSNNETGFRLERRTAGGTFATLTTTAANIKTYSDTTAIAGTAYEYRVFAVNGTLVSAASNIATVTTPTNTGTIPPAPSNLTAVVQSNLSVKLTWKDNSTNETGFRIERRYRAWLWETLTSVGANVTTYTDSATIAGVAYEYRVVAINGSGASNPSNGVEVEIPNVGATAVAASIAPTKQTTKKGINDALPK